MKHALSWSAALLATLVLTGCPIYPDNSDGCFRDSDCGQGYACDYASGTCLRTDYNNPRCMSPLDCSPNSYCGYDYECHTGTCRRDGNSNYCVSGYSCGRSDGTWQCIPGGITPQPPPVDAGVSVYPDAAADSSTADVSPSDASEDAALPDGAFPLSDASVLDAARDAAARDSHAE